MKKLTCTAVVAIALSIASTACTARTPSTEATTIELGQVGLSFYAVTGGVVQELLERDGYTVEVTEGSHSEIFPMLGRGDVDILAATWLPNGHAELYEPVQDVTFQIAPIYEDARFFWVVPSYVPEESVRSISDLTEPNIQEEFPKQIVSLPEETGLTIASRRVMEEYGLNESGYELIAGESSEWLSSFEDAVEAEEWVVFPLWQPQWVNSAYEVRRLEDSRNAYGEADTAYLLGYENLRDKLSSKSLERLSNMRLSVDDVTEMDRLVNVETLSPREAARTWIEDNQETVESWGY